MKIYAIITLLFLAHFYSLAQTMVFVDVDAILSKMQGYTSSVSEIDLQIGSYNRSIDSLRRDIAAQKEKLEIERFILSEEAVRRREANIDESQKKMAALQKTYFGSDGFLRSSREKTAQPFLDKIFSAIQDYAVENKIDIVFDKRKQNNIIFASPILDRTKDILKLMSLE